MKKRPLTYDEAVKAYFQAFETTRALPPQPNRRLSELQGSTWFLRNVEGTLATVNHEGEVRTRIGE